MTTEITPQGRARTRLDHARDALNARMTKDNLRLVLENVVTYAAELEDRLAEYERPADEDPIAYTLTDKADGITRRIAPVQALREDEPVDSNHEARLAQLLDTIRTHGGKWSTGSVQAMRRTTGGPVQRSTARRDLTELARRGHLQQHGLADGRFYTLNRRRSA